MTREGFWAVQTSGDFGQGFGVIVLDTNMVVGADSAGILYDGTYARDETTGELICDVLCTASRAGIWLVQTGQTIPAGFSFPATARLPRDVGSQKHADVETPMGLVKVQFTKIRDFPS